MTKITRKTLKNITFKSTSYFIRDSILKGFALKVNPSGTIKYIVEVWNDGKTIRKTIGSHPSLDLQEAREEAGALIHKIKSGQYTKPVRIVSLEELFIDYTKSGRLKPSTLKSYRESIYRYLSDWLDLPVNKISKSMVEQRFFLIKDKGYKGGIPTYSQAAKVMRVLSALLNYAKGDEVIESNPVEVLKLKKISRATMKRDHYLRAKEVRDLLKVTEEDNHPVTLAVHLMLYTGLRKSEALMLKWSDIQEFEGVKCLIISDTKNHRVHYVPATESIQAVLDRAATKSDWVFPSPTRKNLPIDDVRPKLKSLSKAIGITFKCHDLRRTFATRAAEVGIDYLTIKRLLNHRSNDITAQYVQWNSRRNLLVMRDALSEIKY